MNGFSVTDIALDSDGDLVIDSGAGDFGIVEGKDCFIQNLSVGLSIPPCGLVHAPWEGLLLPRESVTDEKGLADVKRRYEDFLASEESIIQDSVEVSISIEDDSPVFKASFKTTDGQNYEGIKL